MNKSKAARIMSKQRHDELREKCLNDMPEMAKKGETHIFRYIRRFHEILLSRLGSDSEITNKRTAWQLDNYLQEHGKFKDTDFIRTLIKTFEYYIQKKDGSNWSIAKSKKNLSGRATGVNQYSKNRPERQRSPVPIKLSQAIDQRLVDIPRREIPFEALPKKQS